MPKLENLRPHVRAFVTASLALCDYCGSDLDMSDPRAWAMDHVIPRSRGGSNKLENLKMSCRDCNGSKGAKTLEEWRTKLATPKGATFTPEQRDYWAQKGITLPPDDRITITFFFEL
jgi:5-methylcytosine-specific restriction endonuclease McrA